MKKYAKAFLFIAKFWPLICGLIVGGLLGAVTHSFSAFLLFGGIGWAYFHFDFFHAPNDQVFSGYKPAVVTISQCDEEVELSSKHDNGLSPTNEPSFGSEHERVSTGSLYMNGVSARMDGAMFSMNGEDGGPGFYM